MIEIKKEDLKDDEYYLTYGRCSDNKRRWMHIFKYHEDHPHDLYSFHAWFLDIEGDCIFQVWENNPEVYGIDLNGDVEGRDFFYFEMTNEEVNAHVLIEQL